MFEEEKINQVLENFVTTMLDRLKSEKMHEPIPNIMGNFTYPDRFLPFVFSFRLYWTGAELLAPDSNETFHSLECFKGSIKKAIILAQEARYLNVFRPESGIDFQEALDGFFEARNF